MKIRKTSIIISFTAIISVLLFACVFANADEVKPTEMWFESPLNVISHPTKAVMELFSNTGNAQVQYHPQGTFPYKFSISMVEMIEVPGFVKDAKDVEDVWLNGRIINDSENDVKVMVLIGNSQGIANHPWDHLIINGTLPAGKSKDLANLLEPLWHAKLSSIMLDAIKTDIMAYLFIFSENPIYGSVSDVELKVDYLF